MKGDAERQGQGRGRDRGREGQRREYSGVDAAAVDDGDEAESLKGDAEWVKEDTESQRRGEGQGEAQTRR